jgi:HAE1 family hydrophobic/amphiphilic exporter-1
MSIAEIFIRRPVMTMLVMLSFLIFGITAYLRLPVSDLPNVDMPTILVSASLPGANPDTMASAVATPLEREFSTIAGLDSMNSINAQGITQLTLQFTLNRDIDAAAQDVQAAISRAENQLPTDMPSPPSYRKVNPADQPIMYIAVTSPALPLYMIHEYADTLMSQQISMVSGVAQVQIFGAQKYAVRTQLDPLALATRKIGIDEAAEAIRQANVKLPLGSFNGRYQSFIVQDNGQLLNAAAYLPVIIAWRNGAPVRLGDVGRAIDSVENDKVASWYNTSTSSSRAVILAIQRQPGSNAVAVVEGVKKLFPRFREQLPSSVAFHILYDQSVSINDSIHDVKFTLVLTVSLVVLVIFLFLRTIAATVIPSVALPLSIIGTFAAMYLFDFSVDNLSLMALTLSVGFVVDDAIVMLENIVRHVEEGETVWEAALKGSREVGFTIVSMTVSLVAVFIPVLFMGGVVGRLLHEFAVTISMAILISGFVSLSLTPMLCSRYLRPQSSERHGRFYTLMERYFNSMFYGYQKSLEVVLRHRGATMAASIIILVLTVCLFILIPKGFLPYEDRSMIFGFTEASQGISFDSMVEHQQQLAAIVRQEPTVKQFMSSVGAGGPNLSGNTGRIFLMLAPRSSRRLSVDEIVQKLRPQLATVPGIRAFLQNLPTVRIGGQLTKSMYQFTLQSPDLEELYRHAQMLESKLQELPLLQDVTSDLMIKNPQVNITIDRDKAHSLGVSAQQIEDALYSGLGTRQVSTMYAPNNQYKVIIELEPRYQADPETLSLLYIRSSHGSLVPLSTVASIDLSTGPQTINHLGQLPAVTLSFNLRPEVSLGEAVEAVSKTAKALLPSDIHTSFQGTAQAFQASVRNMGMLLFFAILVIYIVLGILYESYVHPITILSGLPSAAFGALLTLMLFRIDLNIYGFVGIIMLLGIVKKNAIMMIDFALERQRHQGKNPHDAIYEGCLVRFRPIMMTTMAALMGSLPIALGFGAGAEARRPLGLAVAGGLLFSQLITLYITPVYFTYLDSLHRSIRRLTTFRSQR